MLNSRMTVAVVAAWALALFVPSGPAQAQGASRPGTTRLVLGFGPVGAADAVARVLAQQLQTQMGTPVIVENRPGAAGNIAIDVVANAKPDGLTLLVATTAVVVNPALAGKTDFDLLNHLAPVSMLSSAPLVLTLNTSVPASTIGEFVAYLRANPGKLAYSSTGGLGSNSHLATLLFLQKNGNLDALHVPYKGGGDAVTGLLGNIVQFSLQTMSIVLPLIESKRLNALAITGLRRSPLLPNVPTLAEGLMPGFEIASWNGIMAPANTPPAVVAKLNEEIVKALQHPDVRARLVREGADPRPSTPDEFSANLKSEFERWSQVVSTAGVKLQ